MVEEKTEILYMIGGSQGKYMYFNLVILISVWCFLLPQHFLLKVNQRKLREVHLYSSFASCYILCIPRAGADAAYGELRVPQLVCT